MRNREIKHGLWLEVETDDGMVVVPASLAGDPRTKEDLEPFADGRRVLSWRDVECYGARRRWPSDGPWTLFEDRDEAVDQLTIEGEEGHDEERGSPK